MRRQTLWIPLILILATAFLAGYRIAGKSLDFDERYSLNIATGLGGQAPARKMFGTFVAHPLPSSGFTPAEYWQRFSLENTRTTALADNGQALPYFTLLHGWIAATGLTVASARWLSLLLLLASGALLWQAIQRSTGNIRVANGALALLLANGLLLDLARYIRFYTFGLLLTTLLAWATVEIIRQPNRLRSLLWGIVACLLVTTQYLGVVVLAGCASTILLSLRGRPLRNVTLPAALGFLLPLGVWLFGLGALDSLLAVEAHHQASAAADSALWGARANASNLLTGIAANLSNLCGAATTTEPGGKTFFNIALVLPSIAVTGWWMLRLTKSSAERLWCRMGIMVISIQMLLTGWQALSTGRMLLFAPRYWTFCVPFMAAMIGLAAEAAWRKGKLARLCVITAIGLLSLRASYTAASLLTGKGLQGRRWICIPAATTQDYEGLAGTLARRASAPTDTVIFNRWFTAQCTAWFLRESTALRMTVDTMAPVPVQVSHSGRRQEVPIPVGTPAAARPCL